MIKEIAGEYVIMNITQEGVVIRVANQILTLHDEEWRELVQLCHIIRAAAKEHAE